MQEDKTPAGENNAELNEEDLEQISGGITPIPIPENHIGKLAGDLTQVKLNPGNLGNLNNVINRADKI